MSKQVMFEVPFLAPVPSGHRVEIYVLERKSFLSSGEFAVVYDITANIWYARDFAAMDWVRGLTQSSRDYSLKRGVRGRVLNSFCKLGATDGSFASVCRLHLGVEKLFNAHYDLSKQTLRPLNTHHARVQVTGEYIEQIWPNGVHHRVIWEEPFQIVLHRQPVEDRAGAYIDVHMRLQQRLQSELETVALTLELEDSPQIRQFPTVAEFHARLSHSEAIWLVETVRRNAKLHKIPFLL